MRLALALPRRSRAPPSRRGRRTLRTRLARPHALHERAASLRPYGVAPLECDRRAREDAQAPLPIALARPHSKALQEPLQAARLRLTSLSTDRFRSLQTRVHSAKTFENSARHYTFKGGSVNALFSRSTPRAHAGCVTMGAMSPRAVMSAIASLRARASVPSRAHQARARMNGF